MPIRRRTLIFALAVAALVTGIVVALAVCSARQWDDYAIAWPAQLPVCDGFDFPVGPPDATGFHDMLGFDVEDRLGWHLGNDWTGNGDDNADLGAPVHAAAAGLVIDTRDVGYDWGKVVRIAHGCGVETVYAHLRNIETRRGATVKRGDRIGTVGDADGEYDDAHLHFEMRSRPLPLGGGYYEAGEDIRGYLDPTVFIRAHRP